MECTDTKWARLYFLIFNVVVALVMINIFIGILLDMFQLFWEDEVLREMHLCERESGTEDGKGEIESMYEVTPTEHQYDQFHFINSDSNIFDC